MRINEVAKITGLSIRTLHYYDKIGLLRPNETTDAGYRIYHEDSLETLQQILFFRELEFPLAQIKQIMSNPGYDKDEALQKQKQLLLKKRERMDQLIGFIDRSQKGEKNMNFEAFDESEILQMKEKYTKEVIERWGNTRAYEQSEEKSKSYDKQKWNEVQETCDGILEKFSQIKELPPNSQEAVNLVEEWKAFITKYFYECSDEILSGLGKMYVADARFTKNMDKFADGTTQFIADAIENYCKSKL